MEVRRLIPINDHDSNSNLLDCSKLESSRSGLVPGMPYALSRPTLISLFSYLLRNSRRKVFVVAIEVRGRDFSKIAASNLEIVQVLRSAASVIHLVFGFDRHFFAYFGHGRFLVVHSGPINLPPSRIRSLLNWKLRNAEFGYNAQIFSGMSFQVGEPIEADATWSDRSEDVFDAAMSLL